MIRHIYRITFRSRRDTGLFVRIGRWLREHGIPVAWEVRPERWPLVFYNLPRGCR
jgi:hypothetical protein